MDRTRSRTFLLEKLLSNTRAVRPPGAARAVAKLPRPAVTVIIPTFNRAAAVCEAIESVQAQSFGDWELMVVDDGSVDDTAEAIAPFLRDARIRYIRQDNAGASIARNRGLAETSAPIVCYLDSDNTYYPDFLAKAVDLLATEPDVDLVYGALVTDSHNLDGECILLEPFDRAKLLQGNFIDTSVIVHRRSLVDRYGGWDSTFHRLNDWDLVLRYTAERPARMLYALASNYRVCDALRISDAVPHDPEYFAILRKHSSVACEPPEAESAQDRSVVADASEADRGVTQDAGGSPGQVPNDDDGSVPASAGIALSDLAAERARRRQDVEDLRIRLVDAARQHVASLADTEPELIRFCRAHPRPALTLALLYQIILGRAADADGMRHYLAAASSGRTFKWIAQCLLQSDEYLSLRTGGDWWRTACRNIGEPETAPRAFQSPSSYCWALAQRLVAPDWAHNAGN